MQRRGSTSKHGSWLLASAAALLLLATSCGTGSPDFASDASPSPTEEPSPEPTREPYTEFSAYRSNDPRADDFRLEHPSSWQRDEPDTSRDSSSWTYEFIDFPDIAPARGGCDSFVKMELYVSRVGDPDPFPEAQGVTRVAGERAEYSIHLPGDSILDEINDNFHGGRGCLTLWARALFDHNDLKYGIVMFGSLPSPEHDVEAFERALETFEFA